MIEASPKYFLLSSKETVSIYSQTAGFGPLPEATLQISPNKSFKIDACLPWLPSNVTVGTKVILGRRASVASPCNFNNSAPCGLSKHFCIGS